MYKLVECTCARTCLKQITYFHKKFIKHQIILKLCFAAKPGMLQSLPNEERANGFTYESLRSISILPKLSL